MSDVPRIQPVAATPAGVPIQLVFDADPQKFADGVDVVIIVPGKLEPAGQLRMGAGAILAVVPAEIAQHMRKAIHAEVEKLKQEQAALMEKSQNHH